MEELANDPLFVQEAAARVELQEQLPAEEAKNRVHEWLDEMSGEIRSLDDLIEEIDARHAHYVGLTLERIRHRLHRNENTETRLVEMIKSLYELPATAEELWEDLAEVYHLETVGEDSLYRRPGASEPHEPEPLAPITISQSDRDAMLSKAFETFASPINRESLFAEIDQILETQGSVQLADLPMESDLDLLRLIALHSYRNEESAPYELSIADDSPKVHSGQYIFRNAEIKRRRRTSS